MTATRRWRRCARPSRMGRSSVAPATRESSCPSCSGVWPGSCRRVGSGGAARTWPERSAPRASQPTVRGGCGPSRARSSRWPGAPPMGRSRRRGSVDRSSGWWKPPANPVDALARTPDLLPVLRQAGVVDAGGAGFLLLLDAILAVFGRTAPSGAAGVGRTVAPDECIGERARRTRGDRCGRAERYRGPAVRGDVPPRCARRHDPGVQGGLGGHRGLDRGGRRRRTVELPHPHRRHRLRHRSRAGRRASTLDPRHELARAGRRGTVGARGRTGRRERRRKAGRRADDVGGGRRDGRGRQADLPLARCPSPGRRRPVDEPVDCADLGSGRGDRLERGGHPSEQQEHLARSRSRWTRSPTWSSGS